MAPARSTNGRAGSSSGSDRSWDADIDVDLLAQFASGRKSFDRFMKLGDLIVRPPRHRLS